MERVRLCTRAGLWFMPWLPMRQWLHTCARSEQSGKLRIAIFLPGLAGGFRKVRERRRIGDIPSGNRLELETSALTHAWLNIEADGYIQRYL